MDPSEYDRNETLITLTSEIVAAHVSNNSVSSDEVASLISNVYSALSGLGQAAPPEEPAREPAVSIRSSVKPDYLVCLEDGKKLKMLKRYLRTNFDMSPQEYRERWNLPADYPRKRGGTWLRRSVLAESRANAGAAGRKANNHPRSLRTTPRDPKVTWRLSLGAAH